MADGFDHQDWKDIKFTGGKSKVSENKFKKSVGISKETKLEREIEDGEGSLIQQTVSMEFKLSLQRARLAKKMSQADLAKKCCLQPKIVNDYESGKAVPNPFIIQKLSKALGVQLKSKK